MAQAISGLWAVSIDGIQFAYFNTTQSMVGAWAYRLDGNRQVWQRIPDCKSAAAVRGVAAAYRANGMAMRLDIKSSEYDQAIANTEAKVVKVSDSVIVRDVTIPGGKSVKELADVFGSFKRKPHSFRDSKGRKVAYVAYDGETGVVAYRDYYQPGSDRMLERSITDYLTTHNLVKAA